MRAHDLQIELGCTINDLQRTARELGFSIAVPSTELTVRQAQQIRARGVITAADAKAKRVVIPPTPALSAPFDAGRAPRPATRPRPAAPRGRGVVEIRMHEEVFEWLIDASAPIAQRRRAQLVLHQILATGRPNHVKPVTGPGHGWRRTALGGNGGNQFYLWWAPDGAPPVVGTPLDRGQLLVRAVRHHDATDQALDADPARWLRFEAGDLTSEHTDGAFPFAQEQTAAARSAAPVRIVRGHPGSGKTTVLHLATRFCERGRAIYVTHSTRLAVEAKQAIATFGPADLDVDALTYREFLDAFFTPEGTPDPRSGADIVGDALRASRERRTGWEGHATELFAELHAHLVGRALPVEFRGRSASAQPWLDVDTYVELRSNVLGSAARAAATLVPHADRPRAFHGPVRAHEATVALLSGGPLPERFAQLEWIIVDEVQDLTPVELLLLLEVARAVGRRSGTVPGIMLAGDEGQTVRPTDFDWGELSDLVRERLGVHPERHELHGNVRCPRDIATVVNRSWELYGKLQKSERPRGYAQAEIDETVPGRVIQCRANLEGDLDRVLDAFGAAPNVALVFPGADVPPKFRRQGVDVWTSESIKGLDFQTVVVLDAGQRLLDLHVLATSDEPVKALWARTLADQMRVALSRPTDTLVLLDTTDDTAVRNEIGLLCRAPDRHGQPDDHVDGWLPDVEPNDLIALLQREEADAASLVSAYLDDARMLLFEDPQRAHTRAVQACGHLGRPSTPGSVQDPSLRREAWRLRALTAANIGLSTTERHESHKMFGDANRYFREAGSAIAAQAMLDLRRLREDHADAPTAARDLIANVAALEGELSEVANTVDDAIIGWARRVGDRPLPDTQAARRRVIDAVAAVSGHYAAHHPHLAAIVERVRLRVASVLIQEQRHADALVILEVLVDRQAALEARCHEALGQYVVAADRWESAGDPASALRCAREVPDLARAIVLAQNVDRAVAERLGWLSELCETTRRGAATSGMPFTETEYQLLENSLAAGLGWKGGLRVVVPSALSSGPKRQRAS